MSNIIKDKIELELNAPLKSRKTVLGYHINRNISNEKNYLNLHNDTKYIINGVDVVVPKIEPTAGLKDLAIVLYNKRALEIPNIIKYVFDEYYRWNEQSKSRKVIQDFADNLTTNIDFSPSILHNKSISTVISTLPSDDVAKSANNSVETCVFLSILVMQSHCWDVILQNPYVSPIAQDATYMQILKNQIKSNSEFDALYNSISTAVDTDKNEFYRFVKSPFFYVSPKNAGIVIPTVYKEYAAPVSKDEPKLKVIWNNGKETQNTQSEITDFISKNPSYSYEKQGEGTVKIKLNDKKNSTVNPSEPTGSPSTQQSTSKPTKIQNTVNKVLAYSDWSD